MDNYTFEFFRKKLETMELSLIDIKEQGAEMAQTLQDLQAAITALSSAIDADATQDQAVITAIEALIAKINQNAAASDFTNEVAALAAAAATLSGSNSAIQAELAKAAAV